jgi:hypothetical protein
MDLGHYLPSSLTRIASVLLFAAATGCSEADEVTNPWSGTTYLLDIAAEDWYSPRGIGKEIDEYVPNFLLRADDGKVGGFRVSLGAANAAGEQDRCNLTSVVDGKAEPPSSSIGPAAYPLFIQHSSDPVSVVGTIYGLKMTDVLPDGDAISDVGEFEATMDFRALYPLFTVIVDPTADKVCTSLAEDFDSACEPCPTDGEPYCLTVKANRLGATPTSVEIETIESVDDPACMPTVEP